MHGCELAYVWRVIIPLLHKTKLPWRLVTESQVLTEIGNQNIGISDKFQPS